MESDVVVARAIGLFWEETHSGHIGIAFDVFVGDFLEVAGGLGLVVGEKLAEADDRQADFLIFGKDGSGIVDLVAEDVRIKIFDIVIIGEILEGGLGVASWIEGGIGAKADCDTNHAGDDNSEKCTFEPI